MAEGKPRVLLVEDNRADARLIELRLEEARGTSFELTHVSTLAEALAKVAGQAAVLLDLSLPDGTHMPMTGTVVRIVDATEAASSGKRAGLGVKLDAPPAEHRQRFHDMLAHALSLTAARRADQRR